MKDRDVYAGIVLVIVSIIGYIISINLPHTVTTTLSSGFYPAFLFAGLGLCGLGLIYQGWKRQEKIGVPDFYWKKILPILILSALYAVTLKALGFRISTFIFVIICMYVLGERKKLALGAVPIVTSLGIFYLFSKVFLIALP